MKRDRPANLPKDWVSRIKFYFDFMDAKKLPIPKRENIAILLRRESTRNAYGYLINRKGEKQGTAAFVSALTVCANWLHFATNNKRERFKTTNAKRRAAELRAAKECPFLDDGGKHHLEVAARFYDLLSTPRGPGRPKETFLMALASALSRIDPPLLVRTDPPAC